MLKALGKHLLYLMTFRHNGIGLKTDRSFTFLLFFLCLVTSILSYENMTFSVIFTNFLSLSFLYIITNKEVVNGMFLGMFFFLFMTWWIPFLSLFILIWVIIATTKMQKDYLTKKD